MIKPINFGYKNVLKTEWLNGNLPTVKKGFYGDTLTKTNVTLEHLKPHSKGGKTELPNLVLASKRQNMKRSNEPLRKFFNPDTCKEYLAQFVDVKTPLFDGNKYIKMITKRLKGLLK